jgi:glutamyl-Q tRNA(Asp) synthetase
MHYEALQQQAQKMAYPCGCTRKDIEAAWQAQGLTHERGMWSAPTPEPAAMACKASPPEPGALRWSSRYMTTRNQAQTPPNKRKQLRKA